MEIINAHVHVYPDKIAFKASQSIGFFYDAPVRHDGTIEGLLKENKENGISRCLIHSVATNVHQVYSINDFVHDQCLMHKEFFGFMALHPDMDEDDINKEVERAMSLGLKGVKLHPDCQKFYIDEDRAEKIYRVVEGKLPILMHMGDARYDYSDTKRLVDVLNRHKDLIVIAAHMGGYTKWDKVDLYKQIKNDNFYFDTSSSLSLLSKEQATDIIRKFGVEKFFFGSDYPMWNANEELSLLNNLLLTDDEKEKILGLNIKNFLKL